MQITKELAEKILLAAGITTSAVLVASKLIYWFGFTPKGIAAKSLAAKIHSLIGIVPKGSIFSFLQSVGAKNSLLLSKVIVPAAVVGGSIGAVYVIYKYRA